MKTLPIFLKVTGRPVIVVGGGEQAAQKARLVTRTEAELVLLAPRLEDELATLVAVGRARHDAAPVAPESFAGAALVFIATGCPGADAALRVLAAAAGVLVNVVDQPELCDVFTPSIVDRDPLVVAIGTEGTSPVLGRQVRARIEAQLEPGLGALAALAGRLRPEVAQRIPQDRRRAFWHWVFEDGPRHLQAAGDMGRASAQIRAAIAAGGLPERARSGAITLVAAGARAADMLTLRAMRHLQDADMLFVTEGTSPGIVDLARRDAERVRTATGADVSRRLLAEARAGRAVVHLVPSLPDERGMADWQNRARALGVVFSVVPAASDTPALVQEEWAETTPADG